MAGAVHSETIGPGVFLEVQADGDRCILRHAKRGPMTFTVEAELDTARAMGIARALSDWALTRIKARRGSGAGDSNGVPKVKDFEEESTAVERAPATPVVSG